MKKVSVFLAEGFEENEALIVVDLLRRAGVEVTTVSITQKEKVISSHKIPILADVCFDHKDFSKEDMLVMPGGIPGVPNLQNHEALMQLILTFANENKWLAAVCAGPAIFAELDLLKGKNATCHPCKKDVLKAHGANYIEDDVVVDETLITSRGLGTSIPFALTLVKLLTDEETAKKVAEGIVYQLWDN